MGDRGETERRRGETRKCKGMRGSYKGERGEKGETTEREKGGGNRSKVSEHKIVQWIAPSPNAYGNAHGPFRPWYLWLRISSSPSSISMRTQSAFPADEAEISGVPQLSCNSPTDAHLSRSKRTTAPCPEPHATISAVFPKGACASTSALYLKTRAGCANEIKAAANHLRDIGLHSL
jgi:hypothetical protein